MDVEKWVKDAIEIRKAAYVPYSHFEVGACLVTKSGKEYLGCNIENASYGLSNCAERTAIFKAVSEGEREFQYMVIAGDTDEPIVPCGACRQVMSEFCGKDMPVLLVNTKGDRRLTTVGELLPGAFSKDDM
ncbi:MULTISPECIES: cytidine deaminase [Heyndrickxia]|jgi:cytidine deaminase|uniref:Cytidine deaminase n=2 Tax=Heyndrickxia coagulans TaxID=1398 RepID=A0A150K770_HEYCO|nr:cytidine deaminase [Heyndrickxia coagulans]AEH54652.1 cytidine deaminase [Heyndrickxia coagulans 2-6]AJH77278.1 cytidine deaminase [Heyndrickxia coagulans DSM 1 = ATCC 7050]KYC65393.1 Cytidine deaminase [Heyndrickxia coagulans]KYC71263.1 Cytidine deaminase [Heyndrickxia coagulans]MCR2846712.1 cytidine deaminase [Heyndrickxia coagulans]